ncbi:MAG TPA: hypothetical protein VJA23_00485 [Candidatus Nanoarchaeia archaeon]|nr:hypothetical protein [Candidatus Nanoarchaeia archaeon]
MAFVDALRSFQRGMEQAAEIIVEERPTSVLIPMMGSVPFVDCMAICNQQFNPELADYMPASSSIEDVNLVMKEWMKNYLNERASLDQPIKIMGIDEVVSGQSAVRVYRAVTQAIDAKKRELAGRILQGFDSNKPESFTQAAAYFNTLTNHQHYGFISDLVSEMSSGLLIPGADNTIKRKRELVDLARSYVQELITYHSLGIEDGKMNRPGKRRSKEYLELRERGAIIPLSVEAIVTMDKPELCPPKYEERTDPQGHLRHLPNVTEFRVTPEYLAFLTNFAFTAGKPPVNVNPTNLQKMLDSSKYLNQNKA